MMADVALSILTAFLLPPGFVLWMAGPWVRSRFEVVLLALMTACFIGFIFLAGASWSWFGMWTRWIPVGLLAAGLVLSGRRWSDRPWTAQTGWTGWLPLAITALVACFFALQLSRALAGRTPGVPPVEIAMPLESGRYVVANGGSTAVLNGHHVVAAQRFALDILALDDADRRADGILPSDVGDYVIYGRALLAPCGGTVVGASDGQPDTPIGGTDRIRPAGNHVLLACEIAGRPVTLLLAHMQPGSLAVAPGEVVVTGDMLGRVGSSGNSSEPHLHIHAVDGTQPDLSHVISSAVAVPLSIEGEFLVRNGIFGSAR